jgi:hypothetical protein
LKVWLLYNGFMQNLAIAPHRQWINTLPVQWVMAMHAALIRTNLFVISLQMLGHLNTDICPNAHLTLQDTGTGMEIAAIMSYDNTTHAEVRSC